MISYTVAAENPRGLSIADMQALVEQFKAIQNNQPVRVFASPSMIRELDKWPVPVLQSDRLGGSWRMVAGLQVIPQPVLRDGCYVIEYGDGHLEWHGPEGP